MILPRVARFLLWLGGWTVVGGDLPVRKAVIIAGPHTSNWDGFWAIVYKVYTQIDIRWFVKDSMFWFPLNLLLRVNGAILRMRRAEIDRKFDEIVDFSGVERFLDTPVKAPRSVQVHAQGACTWPLPWPPILRQPQDIAWSRRSY